MNATSPDTSALQHTCKTDSVFDQWASRLQFRFGLEQGKHKFLFQTSPTRLWDTFLSNLPKHVQQEHTCMACAGFMKRYGNLVTIDEAGQVKSAIWDTSDAGDVYYASVRAVKMEVERARVRDVFYTSTSQIGASPSDEWNHMMLMVHTNHESYVPDAAGKRAAMNQRFIDVGRALRSYKLSTLESAETLILTNALPNTEKVRGPIQWLLGLKRAAQGAHGNNLVWRAIAAAPEGFCHIRAGSSGKLLEDIQEGMDIAGLKRRHAERMNVMTYQRSTALPASATVARAEKTLKDLGLERSLLRRLATLDDLQKVWEYRVQARTEEGGGLFAKVQTRDNAPPKAPAIYDAKTAKDISLEKFKSKVLPTAEEIELAVPPLGIFAGFMTAVDPSAPPIYQWDRADARNPVSVYASTIDPKRPSVTPCSRWNLTTTWTRVQALVDFPPMWGGVSSPNHATGSIFILEGAHETSCDESALFPADLVSTVHPFRAVIDEFSKKTPPAMPAQGIEAVAAGLLAVGAVVRVTVRNVVLTYRIDREE